MQHKQIFFSYNYYLMQLKMKNENNPKISQRNVNQTKRKVLV